MKICLFIMGSAVQPVKTIYCVLCSSRRTLSSVGKHPGDVILMSSGLFYSGLDFKKTLTSREGFMKISYHVALWEMHD